MHESIAAGLTNSISSARRTTHELVVEQLRQMILTGDLRPGSRLVQSELAQAMGVSTTPVREALRDLATEGLVRFDPHRGAVIPELSTKEFEEIYEVRMVLEPMAIRKAVTRVSPDELRRLEELHRRMQVEENPAQWVQLNRDFHMSIYEAGVSQRVAAIIQSLLNASVMYVGLALGAPGLLGDANEGHEAILAAVEAGDADAAAAATLSHLRSSMSAFNSIHD